MSLFYFIIIFDCHRFYYLRPRFIRFIFDLAILLLNLWFFIIYYLCFLSFDSLFRHFIHYRAYLLIQSNQYKPAWTHAQVIYLAGF